MTQKLYDRYPLFHVAVDCVIFTYDENQIKVLLYPRNIEPQKGKWSLMGGFVDSGESLEDAARRVLLQTVGLNDIYLDQVYAFSSPNREPEEHVISMAFYALVRIKEQDNALVAAHNGRWWPINRLPELIFDHSDMIDMAMTRLQFRASHELIGRDLLAHHFTLSQLNNLYNAIFMRTFDSGNFRKKIMSLNVLKQTPFKDNSTSKKGAYLYTFPDDYVPIDFTRIVKI